MSVIASGCSAILKGLAKSAGQACRAVVPKAVGVVVEDSSQVTAGLQKLSLTGLVVKGLQESQSAMMQAAMPYAPPVSSLAGIAQDVYVATVNEGAQKVHDVFLQGASQLARAAQSGGSDAGGGHGGGGGGDGSHQVDLQVARDVSRSSNDSAANVARQIASRSNQNNNS